MRHYVKSLNGCQKAALRVPLGGKQVIFIADREFYSTEYRKIVSKELKWDFVLRLSADQTSLFFADGTILPKGRFTLQEREEKDGTKSYYCPLNQLKIKEGEAYYFTGIRLTLKKDGPYQVAAVWDKGAKEAWLIVSNLPDPTILPKIYPPRGGQGHCQTLGHRVYFS